MSFFPNSSRQGAVQVLAVGGTAVPLPNPIGSETYQIRLASTTGCFYVVSEATNVVAATAANGSYLPPNFIEFVTVSPGQKLSVIQASAAGSLSVTEVA